MAHLLLLLFGQAKLYSRAAKEVHSGRNKVRPVRVTHPRTRYNTTTHTDIIKGGYVDFNTVKLALVPVLLNIRV